MRRGCAVRGGEKDDQPQIRFCVLGPLRVLRDGAPVPVGGAQQRAVLALLLVERERAVSVDRIADALWADRQGAPSAELRHRRQPGHHAHAARQQIPGPTCQIIPPGLSSYRPFCPYTVNAGPSGEWTDPDLARAKDLVARSGTSGKHIIVWDAPATPFGDPPPGRYFVHLLRTLGYDAHLHPSFLNYATALPPPQRPNCHDQLPDAGRQ